MSRTPMTPERFQSRDVKRRISALEKQKDYLRADHNRLSARLRIVEAFVAKILSSEED